MDDVFISYARSTEPAAKAAAEALRRHGFSTWMDHQLPAHTTYADTIAERIDSAKAVLVIWSEAATRSQWVRSEANRGRENGRLVQMRVDSARLPMPFDQVQCVDLQDWSGDPENPAWQIVLDSVAALTGASPREPEAPLAPPATTSSLAVLPFRDLSPAQDQGYFCEGIAEELLMSLTRLPDLRVASSAAIGQAPDVAGPRQIAQTLGVQSFLEGSVRRSKERTRVAVRLTETRTGFTIWGETFDRDGDDEIDLQDEIAASVAKALGVKLLAGAETTLSLGGTSDPAAYDLYLRAKHLVRKELESERRSAAELLREATRRDPSFSLAFAALAEVLVQIARQRVTGWQAAEQEAIAAAEQAIALAPDLPEAHVAHGAALRLRHDPAARAAYERAVALNPNDPAIHYAFARFLVLEGEKREAISHYERAFDLAPEDYRFVVYTLQEYQALGDAEGERLALDRSWKGIEQHLRLNPDDVRAIGHGAGVLALLGRKEEAEEFIARALALRPDDYGNLATLACAAALNQDNERALDLLESAVATGRGDKEWMLQDNDLAPLHGHPRFEALVARMS